MQLPKTSGGPKDLGISRRVRRWIGHGLLGVLILIIALCEGAKLMDKPVTKHDVTDVLDQYAGSQVPGLQYIVADADGILFEYAGGWGDIQHQEAMTLDTTLRA